MGLYSGGLALGRVSSSEIFLFFFFWGGGYFWKGLFLFLGGGSGGLLSEFYGIFRTGYQFDCIPFQKRGSTFGGLTCTINLLEYATPSLPPHRIDQPHLIIHFLSGKYLRVSYLVSCHFLKHSSQTHNNSSSSERRKS